MAIQRILHDTSGQAAAEMALVLPILIGLLFGAAELGYYFYNEHVVVDAVRNGARFAARQPLEDVDCSGIDAATETAIQQATRLTSPDAADTAENRRITSWDSNATVTVAVSCVDNDGYLGLYSNLDQLPRVRVSAEVPYPSLFGAIGLDPSLDLKAASEAAVTGS